MGRVSSRFPERVPLVAEWIHFILLGIILPTIKVESVHFLGLMNSATKFLKGIYNGSKSGGV